MAYGQRDWALGALVEDALGPFSTDVIDSDSSRRTRAVGNWYRLIYVFATGDGLQKMLDTMSVWHTTSFRMLYEWWTASYQDPAFSLAEILELLGSCRDMSSSQEEEGFSQDQLEVILQCLRIKQWPEGDIDKSRITDDFAAPIHYHNAMRRLFRCEFEFSGNYGPLSETSISFASRRSARIDAAMLAYCQQFSWALYHHRILDKTRQTSLDETMVGKEAGGHKYGGNLLACSIPSNDLLVRGPVIEPCPWLENKEDELHDLPYYLWDVQSACTVETASLSFRPEYTAISHTWGRWRKGEPIDVGGIPWRVPQNTRFDVRDLSKLLSHVPGKTPFVWLDLVCIPQDGSITQTREIARQAKIFRSAKHVIAWLNELESFDGLPFIIEWQALQLLRFQSGTKERECKEMVQEAWSNISGKTSNLLSRPPGMSFWEDDTLNPWFTSLWTLQEVALRPDMWLCTKTWDCLTCDGITPIPFSGFIAIFNVFVDRDGSQTIFRVQNEISQRNFDHVALFELSHWRITSGLNKLLEMDRVSLITLGDRRECRGRRAEAIMSALGITDWYTEGLSKVKPGQEAEFRKSLERDLVLGKYPLRFLHELYRLIPGEFFGTFAKLEIDLSDEPAAVPQSPGSLLPFSNMQTYYVPSSGFRRPGVPPTIHESIMTWKILPTGQVQILQACIISSPSLVAGMNTLPIIPVSFAGIKDANAPLPSGFKSELDDHLDLEYEDPSWASLHLWISNQPRDTYAIVIECAYTSGFVQGNKRSVLQVSGLIIQRTPSGSLVKKDNFAVIDEARSVDMNRTETVDWIVD